MGTKRSLVLGVGVNDWIGPTTIDGKQIKEYLLWKSMIVRCYGDKNIDNLKSYLGVSCDKKWLSMSAFIEDLKSIENYEKVINEDWAMDKDILEVGNKIYSKDTVCFVPKEINNAFKGLYSNCNKLPSGITKRKGSGSFYVSISINGKTKYLGSFSSLDQAKASFIKARSDNLIDIAARWKGIIADNVYNSIIKHAENMYVS